jgi:hypothetical protein
LESQQFAHQQEEHEQEDPGCRVLLFGYKEAIRGRDIVTSKIDEKDTNRGGELGMNHGGKLFTDRGNRSTED